jgi:hypothetical protein
MKFNKSTTILLDVVLFLLIVLLVKSIITMPKSVYASSRFTYKIVDVFGSNSEAEVRINRYANEGWRLHSTSGETAIFER